MEKPNRAERRKSKFGGGRATAHGGWPTVQPNPVFHGDNPTDEPVIESPTADDQAKRAPAPAPEPAATDADTPAG